MDVQKLLADLKASGQLSEFMAAASDAPALFNCSTQAVLAEGPYGNLYRRQMVLDSKGTTFEGHTHNYDHLTYLIRGKVVRKVWDIFHNPTNGETFPINVEEEVFVGPCWMLIRKGKCHSFTALTDDVIAECVYALRDANGYFTESHDGSRTAYV